MQIPIIILLVFFSGQASQKYPVFKYIKWGWLFNAILIFLNWLRIANYDLRFQYGFFDDSILYILLRFLSSYFFFKAALSQKIVTSKPPTFFKKNLSYFVITLLFIVQIITLNLSSLGDAVLEFIYIPTVLFDFISLFLLARYFNQKFSTNLSKSLLYYGFLLYSFLQLFALLNPSSFQVLLTLTYLLSIFSKAIILYGVHQLFLEDARKQYETEVTNQHLSRVLGRTFHEITSPLKTIHSKLNRLLESDSSVYKLSSKTKDVLKIIDSNYNRMIAVVSASIKMYEEGIGNNYDWAVWNKYEKNNLSPNNINTILELAIISIKDILEDEESINFNREYGGNCNLICSPHELTQAFYNILKNSVDSFEGGLGSIFIKTKIVSLENDNDKSAIQVIIQDDGVGISEEIIDNIFHEGFSTKASTISRGFGLSISKSIVELHHGKIEVQSIKRSNNSNKNGTFTTILLPKDNKAFN